jgi:predicted MarR family transcription regulator
LASIGLVEASKRARKKTPRSEVTGVEVTDIYVNIDEVVFAPQAKKAKEEM